MQSKAKKRWITKRAVALYCFTDMLQFWVPGCSNEKTCSKHTWCMQFIVNAKVLTTAVAVPIIRLAADRRGAALQG